MASLTITAKVQIYADEVDQELLFKTMKAYTAACNYVSGHVFETGDLNRQSIQKNVYQTLRSKYNMKSQMAISVIRTVVGKYKTILENQKRWIKPVFKVPQYDLVWNKDYSLNMDYFSVNTLVGRIKLPYNSKGMEQYFDHEKYKFGTAKLVFKHGKFFLHIPVSFEVKDCDLSNIANVVGIDRGINFIIATYDSDAKSDFVRGGFVKQKRATYKRLRQELQARKTPSSRRRLLSIGHRENRWMQDVNHCVSKALVEKNPENTVFVLEDLTGIRAVTELVRKKDRYVQVSWSYYDLEQKIMYKAEQAGSKVIKVDPAYTSQRCPVCGHIEPSNRNKKRHEFCCKKCGYRSNDDRIGAMNLHRKGIEFLTSTGCSCSRV